MVFYQSIQTYQDRIIKYKDFEYFDFGPKLAEIVQFFMLFVAKRILLMRRIKLRAQGENGE
jgi:hypothetical protein